MSIRILLTGGTFDKLYSVDEGELTFEDSHIEEMLDRANATADIVIDDLDLRHRRRHPWTPPRQAIRKR